MKKILLALCVLGMFMIGGTVMAEDKLSIVATDFPCYDFARQVAGERANVTMLIKPGVEVHSYEPSPSDILAISQADLFVYIGGEGDAWVRNILEGFDAGEAPQSLRMMDVVEALPEAHDSEAHSHDAETPEYDEHIWTSPQNALRMVAAMATALSEVDPDHAADYASASANYSAQIAGIDAAIAQLVQSGVRHELIFADRFPFLYLVREYGLDYTAAFPSCSAETEPSPKTIMSLIDRVIEDQIPVIYTIEMSTQTVAKTIAEATGAQIETLHSVQTVTQQEFEAGESYVSLMWKNVDALQKGLS